MEKATTLYTGQTYSVLELSLHWAPAQSPPLQPARIPWTLLSSVLVRREPVKVTVTLRAVWQPAMLEGAIVMLPAIPLEIVATMTYTALVLKEQLEVSQVFSTASVLKNYKKA